MRIRPPMVLAELLLLAGFGLVISAPILDGVLGLDPTPTSAVGNVSLTELPHLTLALASIPDLVSALPAYYADHFGFRGALVRLSSWCQLRWLGQSSVPQVIVGREGWLFLNGQVPEGRSLGPGSAATRPGRLTSKELDRWAAALEYRSNWLGAQGVRYVFVVSPDKQTLYPEYLPWWAQRGDAASLLDQLASSAKTGASTALHDLRPALRSHKPLASLYLRNDTHWNELGAHVAAQALTDRLHEWFPELAAERSSGLQWSRKARLGGDLAAMLSLEPWLVESCPSFNETRRDERVEAVCVDQVGDRGSPSRAHQRSKGEPGRVRVLLCGDSFRLSLGPALRRSSSALEVVSVRRIPLSHDALAILLEQARPDVVIEERVERMLVEVP